MHRHGSMRTCISVITDTSDTVCGPSICVDCRLYGVALTSNDFVADEWDYYPSSGAIGTGIVDTEPKLLHLQAGFF